jgi:UDP-N-acetylglucosamine 2-epimerase (non-hydrolysing)/GDP/UDP-N,N'-diacetylbacillosamine 2-epimerase (hydrolysing)
MKKRKICVLTGTRAEYGLLQPVMHAIARHPGLRLQLIAGGMHLDRAYGHTVDQILHDGWRIDARVPMPVTGDSGAAMARAVGQGILGMTRVLRRLKPDVLMVLGDRIESLAGAIAAVYLGIPVAHIHGGDTSAGGLDESNRHAITKFAHFHFPATRLSAARIIKMGEDPQHVTVVGAPGLDTILHVPLPSRQALEKKLGISLRAPVILLVQHPVTTEVDQAGRQIRQTLAAIRQLNMTTIIIHPNSDAGSRQIVAEIKKAAAWPQVRVFTTLDHTAYLGLLRHASVMVGNSSSGIIEAPSFCLPVVNIGGRQRGREQAGNVIDVGYNEQQIVSAVRRALSPAFRARLRNAKNPYGDGHAGERIARRLAGVRLDGQLLQKKLAY